MTGARAKPARRALTLVECTLAIALVAGLFVGVAQLVAGVSAVRAVQADRTTARVLADALAAELADLQVGAGVINVVASESPDRRSLVSVIQHHGLSESPISARDGTPHAGFAGWSRHVRVAWVDPANPSIESATDTGAVAVTVTVRRDGRDISRITVYRTRGWDAARKPELGSKP